ncbi:hypothetical protein J2M53_10575 [Arthrobacter sp. zg-ZUI100]|uniref:hypothetical protein n=1 Tax=Arthrobacter jiangjiafuii TaxID=2817475 RepID=UPI001AEE628B|nr:hypothetical protein [Arthrobacter jiangjiafuii]MBP3036693.1 hypothetical protein [Arthrobacter jiangjiafuii]
MSSATCPLVQGQIDVIADPVGFRIGQGPIQRAQHQPNQGVCLPLGKAQPVPCGRRKPVVRGESQEFDAFQVVGVGPQSRPDLVTEDFLIQVCGDDDRNVPAHGRHT